MEANWGVYATENDNVHYDPDMEKFNSLMKATSKEFYPRCKQYNKFSFLLHLYNVECHFG